MDKYKEALSTAKELYQSKFDNPEFILALESIFPELKENEDNEIKNEIIEFISFMKEKGSIREDHKCKSSSWITWLEKQGKQNPTDKIEPKFKVGDWVVSKFDKKARQISEVHCDEYNNYYIVNGNEYNIEEYDRLHHLWTIQDVKDGDVLVASDNSIFLFKGVDDCACKHYAVLTTDGSIKFNEGLKHYWETSCAVHPATKEQRNFLFQKMKEAGYEWDTEKKELKKIEQKPLVIPKFRKGDFIRLKTNPDDIERVDVIMDDYYILDTKYECNHVLFTCQDLWELVEQKHVEYSEDEKIRKDILQFVKNWLKGGFPKYTTNEEECNAMIAWLEKQSSSSYEFGYTEGMRIKNKEWIEKQKSVEGTFVNIDEVRDEFMQNVYRILDADTTNDRANQIINVFDTLPTVSIWQNPIEWSDYDRCMLSNIVDNEDCPLKIEEIEWLKSLSPQKHYYYNPYKAVVESIAKMCDNYTFTDERSCDFLNNIKIKCKDAKQYDDMFPRSHWKPNEEQIEAVEKALSLAKNCGEEYSFDLRTLLEQLKAL